MKLYFLSFFLIISIALKAQFHIIPHIGGSYANLIIDDEYLNSYYGYRFIHIEPLFGVLVSKNLNNNYKLQADFMYSKRTAETWLIHPDSPTWFIDSDNFDIGAQFAYDVFDGFLLELGMYYSHLLKMEIEEYNPWFNQPYLLDDRMGYEDEIGASVGVSYTFFNVMIRTKFLLGLWGTRENEKYRMIQLTLGYRFEI